LQLKKRAIFYKWLALSIFTLLIGVSSSYLYELNSQKEQFSLNNKSNKAQNFPTTIASKKPSSTSLVKENKITAKAKIPTLNTNTSLVATTKAITNNQLKTIKISKKPVVKQKYTTKRHSKTSVKAIPLKNKKEITSTLKQEKIIANTQQKATKNPINQANNKPIAAVNSKPPTLPIVKNNKLAAATNKQKQEKFTNSKMDLIVPLTPNFALLTDGSTTKTPNNATHFPPMALIPAKILSHISISAFAAPTFSSRFLKGNSAAFYNKNQKGNLVYNGGFDVGYNITDKWTVRLGANYSQLHQTVNLNNTKEQNLPINIDTIDNKITVYSSLATVETEDLDELEIDNDKEDLFNFKETQNFQFINIPVFMDYELGNRKLRFVFQLGGELNFTIKSSSEIKIANAKNFNTIKLDVSTKTKTLNFSGYAGVGAKYLLTPKISLIIIPTYSLFFTNLSKESTNKINPYSFGISTGLQYHF